MPSFFIKWLALDLARPNLAPQMWHSWATSFCWPEWTSRKCVRQLWKFEKTLPQARHLPWPVGRRTIPKDREGSGCCCCCCSCPTLDDGCPLLDCWCWLYCPSSAWKYSARNRRASFYSSASAMFYEQRTDIYDVIQYTARNRDPIFTIKNTATNN